MNSNPSGKEIRRVSCDRWKGRAKMAGGCSVTILSRLSSLIENSLHPFTLQELELSSLTKEKEKELLISLSQVLNIIRRWTDEQLLSSSGSNGCRGSDSLSEEHELLNKIIANLIILLNAKSHYVRHMVGNIFLVISEHLLAYGVSWEKFIRLLCICFEIAMCSILRPLPHSLMTEADYSESIESNLILFLNSSTWNGVAENLRILRVVIKHLKGKDDAELVGVLLNSLSICLTKVPWDLLNGAYDDNSVEVRGSSGEAAPKKLFFGNLVQLLCSVVGLIGSAEGASCQYESAILHKACDLVPRLLVWCIHEEWSQILSYFRHKVLILMIKLSFHMQLGCSVLILWLQLLHEYYQDLLSRSISQLECGQNDTLEDSPFLSSLDHQEVCHLSSCHLQRKVVFLFLRCSLTLSFRRTAEFKCTYTRSNASFESDLNTIKDCFVQKNGLLDFYGWLQGHVPSDLFSENEISLNKCIIFASSFIRFYMQEDDMLFEVLLQMFNIPSWAERLFSKRERACHVTEEDILFHVSNLFNPLLLFHVFLAEVQYDHQLLLDYLISKDIGDKCAEYLLRSLRIVCDSWKLFVEYSIRESLVSEISYPRRCKRRRAAHDDSCDEWMDTPLQIGLPLSSEQHQRDSKLGGNLYGIRCLQFEGLKVCLLSLKSSLRKLHRRKLFPYNPKVLISRLTRFEELCGQHL